MAFAEQNDLYTEHPNDQPDARVPAAETQSQKILDPGFNLTLRPMRYPVFYDMYRDAIKNTWTVEEIDFSDDIVDLDRKLLPAERHLINRLVAFSLLEIRSFLTTWCSTSISTLIVQKLGCT